MARYVPKVDYGRLEFEYVPSSGFYRARISTDNSFKKDTDYAVVFDGRRYTVRSTANGAIGGNAYLYDQRKPDTGEPFYLAPAMGLVMASTAGFHSVSYGIMKADGNNVAERLDGLEKTVDSLSEEIENLKGEGGNTITKTGVIVRVDCDDGAKIEVSGKTTEAVTLVHKGKNLLPMPRLNNSYGNVVIKVNVDGAISMAGTITDSTWPAAFGSSNSLIYLPAGTYTFSVQGDTNNVITAYLQNADKTWTVSASTLASKTITISESMEVFGTIAIKSGTTYNDTFYVQLEAGVAATEYAPPIGELFEDVILPVKLEAFKGTNTIHTKNGEVLTVTTKKSVADIINEAVAKQLAVDWADYGIPVLTLDGDCSGMTRDDYVSLAYTFQGQSGTVQVKKQGSSSVQTGVEIGAPFDTDVGGLFNFTLKFPEAFEAKEGWIAAKKYVFKADAIDHSHLRNVGSYMVWGQIVKNRTNVPAELADLPNGGAPDGFPVIIVLNGKFYAVGNFTIPKDGWLFESANYAPKAILCADAHTDATKFKALATLNGDFELEYVEDEDNADWVLTSINRAIQAVMDSDGTDIDTVISQYIDIPSAIDYYNYTVNENADDGTDKNYILVTFDYVKWYFSAYDRDTVYGLHWTGKSFASPVGGISFATYASTHALMNLIYTYKTAELKARAVEMRNGTMSEANIATVFTNYAAGFPSAVLAKNAERWPLLRSTSSSNLAQILNWYRLRRQVIDKEINGWTV